MSLDPSPDLPYNKSSRFAFVHGNAAFLPMIRHRNDMPKSASRPSSSPFFQASPRAKALAILVVVLIPIAVFFATGPWRAERALSRASLDDLQARVGQDPNDFPARFYLARRERSAGQYALALDNYQRVAASDPSDERAWVEFAQTAAASGQLPAAAHIMETFCQANPQSAAGHAELAMIYAQGNSPEQASDEAARATQLDPNLPDSWIAQGKADVAALYYDQSSHQEGVAATQGINAEHAFRQAIALAPDDWRGYAGLGSLQDDLIDYKDAVVTLRKAVSLGAHEPIIYARLGSALMVAGSSRADLDEAIGDLQRAVTMPGPLSVSSRSRSYLSLGQAYQEEDRWRDALPWLTKAVAIDPTDPEAHYDLARSYLALGDTARAAQESRLHETLSQQAIERQRLTYRLQTVPDDNDSRLKLARMFVAAKDDISAARQYQILLQKDPKNAAAQQEWQALQRKHARGP